MKRHQFIKLWAYGALLLFVVSIDILMFSAVWNLSTWTEVGGLMAVNSVIFSLIPVALYGDDLDIPWRE